MCTLNNAVGVGNTVNVQSVPTASSASIAPIVQTSSNPSSKLNISPIAPPLPPRRLHKDSGGCLLPNTGFCKTVSSSSQAGSSLPPPPPIPSHGDLSSFHKSESDNVTVPSHPRRPKTDNQLQSTSHGVLPLPPNQIATSKDQNDMFLFTIIIVHKNQEKINPLGVSNFKFQVILQFDLSHNQLRSPAQSHQRQRYNYIKSQYMKMALIWLLHLPPLHDPQAH